MDPRNRAAAVAALEQAVAAEKQGHYDASLDLYTQGISLLMQVAKTEPRARERQALTAEVEQFIARAERVKQLQQQRQQQQQQQEQGGSILDTMVSYLLPTAASAGRQSRQALTASWLLLCTLALHMAAAAAAATRALLRHCRHGCRALLTRPRRRRCPSPEISRPATGSSSYSGEYGGGRKPSVSAAVPLARSSSLPTGTATASGHNSSGGSTTLVPARSAATAARKPAVPRQQRSGGSGAGAAAGGASGAGAGSGGSAADKRNAELEAVILNELLDASPGVRWADIAGLDAAKRTLQEAVILPNLRPDLFTGLRAPPRGVLLFGPPGTGKTMLAKAVATESHFSFFSISASSLTSKWVGEGEKLVRALFRVARERRPCVIFIDEIDSLLSARAAGEHDAARRLKTEFMVQLDGACSAATSAEQGLLVMGATNLPWELDEAVLRRLARRVYVPLPDGAARGALVTRLLRGQSAELSQAELAWVVQASEGYSASDLTEVTKEAAMQPLRDLGVNIATAHRSQVRPITMADFQHALSVITRSVTAQSVARYQQWEGGATPR